MHPCGNIAGDRLDNIFQLHPERKKHIAPRWVAATTCFAFYKYVTAGVKEFFTSI